MSEGIENVSAPVENVTSENQTESVNESVEVSSGNDSGKEETFQEWLAKQKSPEKVTESVTKPLVEQKEVTKLSESDSNEPEATEVKEEKQEDLPEFTALKTKFEEADKALKAKSEELEGVTSQVKDLLTTLQKEPGKVLDHLNIPREAIEQWYFEKYVKPEQMTTEEKLAQYQERERAAQEKAEADRRAKEEETRTQANREHWSKVINDGLDQAGLPKTDWTISRVASYLKQKLDSGVNATVADVIPQVKQDLQGLQAATLKDLPVEKLIETLGEEALSKIRSHEVNKLRQANKFNDGKKAGAPVKREEKGPKKRFTNPYQLLDDL